MQVQQAIFTSARTAKVHGYHLVARSAGVDERLAGVLSRWGPSHASLLSAELDAASLNFFSAGDGRYVLARTLYGGPEYSGRGGLQVVTRMLVLERSQFDGFDGNPLVLARCALTLGQLRLPTDWAEPLPPLDLPRTSLISRYERVHGNIMPETLRDEVQSLLAAGKCAAVVGLDAPVEALEELMHFTPRDERVNVSFTTGLRPSVHRPFRLHFLPEMHETLHRQLVSQGIHCVAAPAPA